MQWLVCHLGPLVTKQNWWSAVIKLPVNSPWDAEWDFLNVSQSIQGWLAALMNQCISICWYLPFAITNEMNVQISSRAGEMKTAKMSPKPLENRVWKVCENGRGVRHWPHWPWVGVHMNSLHELLNMMFESKPTRQRKSTVYFPKAHF